jgi:hypothetical protein
MAGHKRLAAALAQSITGVRISLEQVPPPSPLLPRTLSLLKDNQPVQVLAMTPLDRELEPVLRELFPQAKFQVTSWPVNGLTIAEIEQDAKQRVRPMKPDLVVIAVPRAAQAETEESFIRSYAWVMNWSLNFGPPTWDCLVVHPSVWDPDPNANPRDALVRALVRGQDLPMIDRPEGLKADASSVLREWLKQHLLQQSQ